MIIKNNTKSNLQYNVRTNAGKYIESVNQLGNTIRLPEKPDIKFIHIPAGATVVIEDDLYQALVKAQTSVQGFTDVVSDIEGTELLLGKDKLKITERVQNGSFRTVSLFALAVKAGEILVIDDSASENDKMDMQIRFIKSLGIPVDDSMTPAQVCDIYTRLNGAA
ncbi:hypothetical protein I6H07_06145 [Hafnia alvei]|nr:hypothetical protein [Hafnia alvei]MBI0275415.1 hypothetical protein [Hafnia alvei]PNK98591.1 hypothetical protein CEQ28_013850 [Hafnia alvei]